MPRRKKAGNEKKSASPPQRRRLGRAEGSGDGAEKARELVDHQIMKGLLKPIRAKILAILAERVASPSELAKETGETLSMVCYHVKVLRECDLIELDHKAPVRGAVERFYRAVNRTIVPADAWDKLPSALRDGVAACILREFFADALESIEAEGFDDPASHLCWTPLIVDASGVAKIGKLANNFIEAVLDTQIEASKRLKKAGSGKAAAEEISMTVFLASFLSARSVSDGKRAAATKRR